MKYQGVPDPGAVDARPRIYLREIKGVEHKLCTGPGHDVPTWLPATEKYFYASKTGRRIGELTSRCRLCQNWDKLKNPGESGTVSALDVQPFVLELVNRIGKSEAARRSNIERTTLVRILNATYAGEKVQKRTVRKIMLQLVSARRKNEVYHHDDLRFGLHNPRRLRPLKRISSQKDLYKPQGDSDNEARRSFRRRTGR